MSPEVMALIISSFYIGFITLWSLIQSTLHIRIKRKDFKYGKLMYNTVTKETILVKSWHEYDIMMGSSWAGAWQEDLLYKKAREAMVRNNYRGSI